MVITRNQKKRLHDAIDSLFSNERQAVNHSYSSIRPTTNQISDWNDALARLVTRKTEDVCVAICYCNNNLFVASNRGRMTCARRYLLLLRNFLTNHSLENYTNLVKETIKNIYYIIETNSGLDNRNMTRLERNFRNWIETNWERQLTREDLNRFHIYAQSFHKEIRERTPDDSLSYKKWDYLMPLHDLNFVVSNIQMLVQTLTNTNTEFVFERSCREKGIPSNDQCNGCKRRRECRENPHAEMKLVNLFRSQKVIHRYIGISKLTCCPCETSFSILNNNFFSGSLHHCGTHGGTYPGWKMPSNFSPTEVEAIIDELERIARQQQQHNKARETTSQIPQQLATMPIFSTVAVQAQQTI